MAAIAQHSILTGVNLHFSKLELVTGTPSVAPGYVGQTQYDEDSNILYVAVGTASAADWRSFSSTIKVEEVNTATYSVLPTDNGYVISLTYAGARTITLPSTPVNGFLVAIQDGDETAFTNNITVSGNGGLFPGGGSSFTINSSMASYVFVYDQASNTWLIESFYSAYQPTFNTITSQTGSALTLRTPDTSSILLTVNGNNVITAANTLVEVKKTFYLDDPTDNTKKISFANATATTGTTTILNFAQTAGRIITFPDITDTLVSKNSTDILTNKSFNNTTTMLAANQLNFNNSGNTFYTSLKGGANAANLNMTLPTTAPIAGQVVYSTDTSGTLDWKTVNSDTQQDVASGGITTTFPSSTSVIRVTGSSSTNIQGIVAGVGGQPLTILNVGTDYVYLVSTAGGAPPANRILLTNIDPMVIYPGSSVNLVYDSVQGFWIPTFSNYLINTLGSLGSNPFLGNVGYYDKKVLTNATFSPTTTYSDITDYTFLEGIWSVTLQFIGASAAISGIGIGLGLVSGNSNSGLVAGDNFIVSNFLTTGLEYNIIVSDISVTTPGTRYFKLFSNVTPNTLSLVYTRISVRRAG